MKCPKCSQTGSRVDKTFKMQTPNVIIRSRCCCRCGHTYLTTERIEDEKSNQAQYLAKNSQ